MSNHDRPNIVLIVLDTLRARNMSLYGYPKRTTPFLEEIAAKSVVFRNAYAAAPWTLPSHASIFTGLYPSRHNANKKGHYLKEDILTLAEYLKSKGYSTASFSANPWVDDRFRMLRGFDRKYRFWNRMDDHKNKAIPKILRRGFNSLEYRLRGIVFDKGAVRINRKISEELKSSEKPFFYFINYMETHAPYLPPRRYKMRFSRNLTRRVLSRISKITINEYEYVFGGRIFPSSSELEILESLYNDEIAYLDDRLNELWMTLRNQSLLENTVIFITSDHGDNIGDHQLLNHELSLYDNLLKVPLMIFYPSILDRKMKDERVENKQIFATVIREIFGENPTERIKSANTISLISDEKPESIYAEEIIVPIKREKLLKRLNGPILQNEYMLKNRLKVEISEDYKYIYSSIGRNELYNMRAERFAHLHDLVAVGFFCRDSCRCNINQHHSILILLFLNSLF